MLKSLLRTARLSSTLRNALQGAEVRETAGLRQFTCVGHDVKTSIMMNGYAPRDPSNHENGIEHATFPSSPVMLLGFHSLLPATAVAVAELSNAGRIQLPSSIESVYGEHLENDIPGQLPPAGSIIDWQCHTKRTFQPSLLVRKRRHGFLARISTRGGRRVIERRRQKGRQKLTA